MGFQSCNFWPGEPEKLLICYTVVGWPKLGAYSTWKAVRTFWHKQASSPLPLVAAKKTIIDHTSKEPAPLCSISIFVVMPHITSVLLHQWQNCSSFSSSFHKRYLHRHRSLFVWIFNISIQTLQARNPWPRLPSMDLSCVVGTSWVLRLHCGSWF